MRQLLRQSAVYVIVAYAMDRLSRNQNHIGVLFDELEQAGARLEFVTEKFVDTATGRFILAAREFIGEVEREKIAERTMRGKVKRARSGKIPQGTGKRIYGYHYNRDTGRREIEPVQSKVLKGIFHGFLHDEPIVAMANRLNEARIPTLTGGMSYPATLHTILLNETYTGRTIYRSTVVRHVRDQRTGKEDRKVEIRDPSCEPITWKERSRKRSGVCLLTPRSLWLSTNDYGRVLMGSRRGSIWATNLTRWKAAKSPDQTLSIGRS